VGLVLLVAGIGVAAIVHVAQTGGDEAAGPSTTAAETAPTETTTEEQRPLPAILPLGGDLRREGGVLWWSDERCRAEAVEVSSGTVTSLPGEHCRIWPSPSGSAVVATAASRSDSLDGRGLVLFGYPGADASRVLPSGSVVEHEPGVIASEVAWATDERTMHVCVATREGTVVDTIALDGASHVRADECFPAILEDGRLATVVGPLGVTVGDRRLLGREEARTFLPSTGNGGRRVVTAVGGGDGELVVGLAAVSDTRLLPFTASVAVLAEEGGDPFFALLQPGTLPAAVGLAPRGDALWFFDAGTGTAAIRDIPGGRQLPPLGARWLAWSPSGDFLAAATERSIRIYTWPDAVEVERIPVAAAVVAWTRAPGG
jgi:hypothetical protein